MKLPAILLLAAGVMVAAQGRADVGYELNLLSDYRMNGVSRTEGGAALQAGMVYRMASGLYAGTWASNVDFGDDDDTWLEWDVYAGFYQDLLPALGVDLGYRQSTFHGDDGAEYDYGEYSVGLYLAQDTSLYWYYAPDYFRSGTSNQIVRLQHSEPLGDYRLGVTVAHNQSGDKERFAWDEDKASYQYYAVSLSRVVNDAEFILSLGTTSIDEDYNEYADTTLGLSVRYGLH